MNPTLCYVTPSYTGDIDRFEILRYSINLFSPRIPHYVLLDTEDVSIFKNRFSNEKNLFFISSEDIIPKELENRRKKIKSFYGRILRSFAWRFGLTPDALNGWRLQQLLKIYFLSGIDFDCAVFLDSDIIFCGPVDNDYFFKDGVLILLETPASNIEDHAFEISTHLILKTNVSSVQSYFNNIHQAPRFYKSTAIALISKLIKEHGSHWINRFIEQSFPSEYSLLGYSARTLQEYEGYYKANTTPDELIYKIYFNDDNKKIDDYFFECREESGIRKFMLIQSNQNVPATNYREPLIKLLDSFI